MLNYYNKMMRERERKRALTLMHYSLQVFVYKYNREKNQFLALLDKKCVN